MMPRGQTEKITGITCNAPVDKMYSSGLVVVKLKCKLENRVHVLFETIKPNFLHGMLRYLKFYDHAFTTLQRCYNQK